MEYYIEHSTNIIDPMRYVLTEHDMSQYVKMFAYEEIDINVFGMLDCVDLIELNIDNTDIPTMLELIYMLTESYQV